MPNCFVIMGFGPKTDLATGRVLDLDKTYKNIIKPAVEAAGFDCQRADEILHSGVIDVPMYEMLYGADLVVADLSTSNLNAVFELGVRHALKPRATIIIAEDQFKIPFDASHIVVRHYQHLGPDIGFDEAIRMRGVIADLARALRNGDAVDSPVYTVLADLETPTRSGRRGLSAGEATGAATAVAVGGSPPSAPTNDSYAAKLEFAGRAMSSNAFPLAKEILHGIYLEQSAPGADGKAKPARPGVVQQLALATYKAGEEEAKSTGPEAALAGYAAAEALLAKLEVETTTDPETLGLWSAVHKRRAEMTERPESERKEDLDKAIRAAERGFLIKRDYYNGANLAYLLNFRASLSSGDDRVADNVLANRVRRDVVAISARRFTDLQSATREQGAAAPLSEVTGKDELAFVARPLEVEKFWVEATRADSLYALGDPSGESLLEKVIAKAPAKWMADIARSQHAKQKTLLEGMRE